MVGHYLLTLTPDQEDRVLTGKMRPGAYEDEWRFGLAKGPCLVGTAHAGTPQHRCCNYWPVYPLDLIPVRHVEKQYDDLCVRFGTERVNVAIRERVLRHRLWRTLAAQRETVVTART